jgi:hypothetical protein
MLFRRNSPQQGQARRSRMRARFLRVVRSTRGSVLIVAMLLAGIIGISLASYLKLSITSLRSANRSFYANSSIDYAEIGIEQAMACFYTITTGVAAATAWTGWNLNAVTNEATRVFPTSSTYYTPGPGARAQVRVYVQHYDFTGSPIIAVKATITPADGPVIEKMVKVSVRSRSLFANGLVARNLIDWAGRPTADSWNSDPDGDGAGLVAYAVGERANNCTIGTVNATNGAIDLANGTVYGTVGTGGGTVTGSPTISGGTSYDFSASFPTVTTPTPATINLAPDIVGTTTFPSATVGTAMNASDGTYYYSFGIGDGIDLSGGSTNIQIEAGKKVVFIMNNHSGVPAISIGGNSFMTVNDGAKLQVYTNGNLSIAGAGVANANIQPSSFLIYGTRTTVGQTMTINGNGALRAGVYAPYAAVTANGSGATGQIQGSIVAYSIDMNGGPDFHYDEALGNLTTSAGVGVLQWRELQSSTERALYSSQLNF